MKELGMDIFYHTNQVFCFMKYLQLAVCSCSVLQNVSNIIYCVPASQRLQHVIDKIQQLVDQHPRIHFFFFAKVDQSAVNAVSSRTPFVFVDECPRVLYEI